MNVPQLEDLPDPSRKNVLLRADFNVPITDGKIDDDMRIRAALPTIEWLIEHGAQVTACSHLGRPKGEVDERYSMDPGAGAPGRARAGSRSSWRTSASTRVRRPTTPGSSTTWSTGSTST